MPVLLTRPAEQSAETARALARDGIEAVIWPLTKIVPICDTLVLPDGIEGVLFTSANGLRAYARLSPRRDLPALCVGPATLAAAHEAGFSNVRSADGDAEALAELARTSGLRRLLHARGAETAGDLGEMLARDGISITEAMLYRAEETGPPPALVAAALMSGGLTPLTVWSPRGARILRRYLAPSALASVTLIAISENAAAPLQGMNWARIVIADRPDGQAMIAAIRRNHKAGIN